MVKVVKLKEAANSGIGKFVCKLINVLYSVWNSYLNWLIRILVCLVGLGVKERNEGGTSFSLLEKAFQSIHTHYSGYDWPWNFWKIHQIRIGFRESNSQWGLHVIQTVALTVMSDPVRISFSIFWYSCCGISIKMLGGPFRVNQKQFLSYSSWS